MSESAPFAPSGPVVTVPQLRAAIGALGINPDRVLSLTIWPDKVSWETYTEEGHYEPHEVRVAR